MQKKTSYKKNLLHFYRYFHFEIFFFYKKLNKRRPENDMENDIFQITKNEWTNVITVKSISIMYVCTS